MILQVLIWVVTGVTGLVLYYDFLFYRIPNFIPISILLLYLVKVLTCGFNENVMFFMITLLLISILGALIAYKGFMGYGDVKLILALSPWMFEMNMRLFFLATSLIGAAISVAYIVPFIRTAIFKLRWIIIKSIIHQADENVFKSLGAQTTAKGIIYGIPYGIAIFSGYLIVVVQYMVVSNNG